MSEQESVSERELAQFFDQEGLLGGQPRSVGEALQAADEAAAEPVPEPPPAPEPPLVVTDEPVQPVADAPSETPSDLGEAPEEPTEVGEEPEETPEGDEHVVWATKKYGDDPAKWAKAAFDQEQHISRLANEKKESDALAVQWYEYANQIEQDARISQQAAMPMSASEEAWVEQSLGNPLMAARQAAFSGNFQLYQAVINRIAEENPMAAAGIGQQVQMELQQAAQQEMAEQNGGQPMTLADALGGSFQRLGLDLATHGPAMSQKIGELGEYHPYVRAILEGDEGQRDLAVQAIHDLTRAGTLTRRVVRDEAKDAAIRREGELRREAAGVVTGSPHISAPKEDPFMAAMEQEWKDRRQWGGE